MEYTFEMTLSINGTRFIFGTEHTMVSVNDIYKIHNNPSIFKCVRSRADGQSDAQTDKRNSETVFSYVGKC